MILVPRLAYIILHFSSYRHSDFRHRSHSVHNLAPASIQLHLASNALLWWHYGNASSASFHTRVHLILYSRTLRGLTIRGTIRLYWHSGLRNRMKIPAVFNTGIVNLRSPCILYFTYYPSIKAFRCSIGKLHGRR